MDLRRSGNIKSSSSSSSSKMSSGRRSKLESIAKREANKGDKRKTLENVLVAKLTKKYGQNDPALNKVITGMVTKLIRSAGRISEADIAGLELSVKQLGLNASSSGGGNSVQRSSQRPSLTQAQRDALAKEDTNAGDSTKDEIKKVNEWVLINALSSVEHDKVQQSKQSKLAKEKEQQQKWLDSQLKEKQEKKIKDKEYQLTFYKQQVQDLKKWQKEEEEKQEQVHSTIHMIKEVRAEQLSERQKKWKAEEEMRRLDEEAEVARCQRLLKEEEDFRLQQKEDEKERMQRVLIENQRVEVVKAKRKQEETEYDIKLMEEYAAKLEKEEQDRIEALASKLRRQDEIHSGMAMSTHELIRKQQEEDQARALEYQQKKLAADNLREENDIRKKKQNALDNRDYLDFQHSIKVEKQMKEREIEEKYAAGYAAEGEKAQLEEKEKVRAIRRKNKNFEKKLVNQMKEQQVYKQQQFASMAPQERSLNAQILKKLEDDELRIGVLQKLSPEKKSKGGKSKTMKSSVF